MTQNPSTEKQTTRDQCIEARKKIDPAYAKMAGKAVAAHVLTLVPEMPTIIACYRAIRGELDMTESMAQLSARGHTIALPVIESTGQPLIFRRWRVWKPLVKSKFDIEIPADDEPVVVPDIIILPLVAFDRKGYRLGYGAGYYDRTIHTMRISHKSLQLIGAGYAQQQVKAIAPESHDEKLDVVVTEKGITRFT